MQEEKKFEEVKPGKYEFFIKGVITADKNGYDLKTQKGNPYSKLLIVILSGDTTSTVFEPIFGKDNLKGIIYSINNPELIILYECAVKNKVDFDLEDLIGESGLLLLGHRQYNGVKYPQVECFLKPKAIISQPVKSLFDLTNEQILNLHNNTIEIEKSFSQELGEADEVPF